MLAEIKITDDDIASAEKRLLPEGKTFDLERRAFIKRLDTIDLQAVPGSGKTTALLAKLSILERYLPFQDCTGILVISHTNAAVDEIKRRIGADSKRLFLYPNFVGTIQGFVDYFLAIPCYVSKFKRRPIRIDNEIYYEMTSKFSEVFLEGFSKKEQNDAKNYLRAYKNVSTFRFAYLPGVTKVVASIQGNALNIKKPRSRTDWSVEEKGRIEEWLKVFKMRIMKAGILCFDDAYYLAEDCLSKCSSIVPTLRNRFRFIFVDEMQDMGKHQHDLLEKLFFASNNSLCAYQRIGDRNQAIHNNRDFDVESAWQYRESVLSFANSYRLSAPIARVVESFALHKSSEFRINGLGRADIKPHMLVYDNGSKGEVVKRFASLLRDLTHENRISEGDGKVFKVVAWNATWDEEDEKLDPARIRLVDYCQTYQKARHKLPTDHSCLDGYLQYFDRKEQMLGAAQKSILNAILKILRLEYVKNPESGRHFTIGSLLKHLRQNHPDFFEAFKLRLYEWSLDSVKSNSSDTGDKIRDSTPELLLLFDKKIERSREFIDRPPTAVVMRDLSKNCPSNILKICGLDIELATVHSVKGQNHTATLYLETYFHQDGRGASAKSYESQRLADQFLKKVMSGSEGKRVLQSTKMAYVGFSRPSHLLCFGVHKDRFDKYLTGLDTSLWEIIEIEGKKECIA